MTAPSSLPSSRWPRLGAFAAWLALGIAFTTPVTRVLEPDLDSSIHASYAYLTAHGFQFGAEANTTAGPYGFVMFGWDFGGELFWPRLALTALFAFVLAALTLWFFRAARGGVWRWLWLAAMLVELSITDTLFTVAALLGGFFLLAHYARPHRRLASFGVAAFLALLALMKGTQLAEGAIIAVAVLLVALGSRAWRRAAELAAAGLAALLVWWIAAGQNPLNLPAYVNGLRHIAQGYNEALALDTPPGLLPFGLGLLAGLGVLFATEAWRHRHQPALVACHALLAGGTFLLWKHGFLRADNHVLIFSDFAAVAALAVPLLPRVLGLSPDPLASRLGRGLLVAGVTALSLATSQHLHPDRLSTLVRDTGARWLDSLHYLARPAEVRASRDRELEAVRRSHDLPVVRQLVGQQSVDFFGYELGSIFLHGLNYRPAPMCCGTYCVYNPHFKELNARHFSTPGQRPDFVLLKIQTIDGRFAAIDDSLSLLALLDGYTPASYEQGTLLLAAAAPAVAPDARVITTRSIRFGEEIAVPAVAADQLLLFSLELPASLRGRVRAFAYKPPLVFLDTLGVGLDQTVGQRIVAASVASPALLAPTVENTDDLFALYAGQNAKRVTSLRLRTAAPEDFDQERLTVTFYSRPRPAPVSPGTLHWARARRVFEDPPDAVVPEAAEIKAYQGKRVQYLHAPSAITYHLRGDERAITLGFGVDQDAYLSGRTDGVDFVIELAPPGQPRQLLARRHLDPLAHPADRGPQRITTCLPPAFAPGTDLIVRTDPGPAGNAGWDWAYADFIGFTRGAFLPGQFPGFSRAPSAVTGASVSPMFDGTRFVTMVNAPAALTFVLDGREQLLRFTGGLMPDSYLSGHTDGAGFSVELETPDGKVTRVFRRVLQPGATGADRGDQTMSVPLPPHAAGSRLHLRTDTGPGADASWDWAYISGLQLE